MSNSGAWGPTPPGINLADNQDKSILASVTTVILLAIGAVLLRFYARMSKRGPGLGLDDYAVVVALILGFGNATCCYLGLAYGGGHHLWSVTQEEFIHLFQTTYAFVIVYIWSVTSYKLAILLFYRRIFGTWTMWYVVTTLTILHGLEVTITWLSGCRPINYYWLQYTDPHAVGKCIQASNFYLANGIIALIVDVSILIAPLPIIWKLQMDTRHKIAVIGILLLGSFVCMTSVVRIVYIDRLVHDPDVTWALCQVFIWSCIEPSIGIVCACLPTYAPLFRRWSSAVRSRTKGSNAVGATPQYYTGSNNMGKRQWSRIRPRDPLEMTVPADEDELELAPEAGKGAFTYRVGVSSVESPESTQSARNITVTKDFTWA